MYHEMRHLIDLFTLYKSSIEHNIELLVIPFYLSLIPDNFQGVTEIVSDGLPKPSRVNIVTEENL